MSTSKRASQADRILEVLERGQRNVPIFGEWAAWVTLPSILALGISQYNARIHELRKRGHNIICEKETVNGQVRSKYRLVVASQDKK